MTLTKLLDQEQKEYDSLLCYNCQTEINDRKLRRCPNPKCQVILNPNEYINWKRSFYIFISLLCISPFIIGILILIF